MIGPVELTFSVGAFSQAVGVKYQHVAGVEHNSPLLIANVVINAEGKADQAQLFAAAALPEQRLRLPSVSDAQLAPAFLPSGEAQRNEAAFNAALAEQLVHLAEHLGGLQFLRGQAAENANGHCTVERCGTAFAADVAQGHAELLRAVTQEVVKVAADFASREDARGNIEAIVFGRHRTQQRALHALRG